MLRLTHPSERWRVQEFAQECFRRFKAWLKAMYKLIIDIMLGLVPIATLAGG